ncbi:MAG: hypothetical protein V2B14_04080 [bacterium]
MEDNDFNNLENWKKFTQHPRLGEILIQHKKITIGQLVTALELQKKQSLPIGEILIQMGVITKDELIEVLKLQADISKMLAESFNELKKLKKE